jgi:hypothetical protein
MDDVCNWLKGFKDGSDKYVDTFKEHKIDPHRFFNDTDHKTLTEYGINDEKARRLILGHISDLKEDFSIPPSPKKQ